MTMVWKTLSQPAHAAEPRVRRPESRQRPAVPGSPARAGTKGCYIRRPPALAGMCNAGIWVDFNRLNGK